MLNLTVQKCRRVVSVADKVTSLYKHVMGDGNHDDKNKNASELLNAVQSLCSHTSPLDAFLFLRDIAVEYNEEFKTISTSDDCSQEEDISKEVLDGSTSTKFLSPVEMETLKGIYDHGDVTFSDVTSPALQRLIYEGFVWKSGHNTYTTNKKRYDRARYLQEFLQAEEVTILKRIREDGVYFSGGFASQSVQAALFRLILEGLISKDAPGQYTRK